MNADPANASKAFAEYAADPHWVASHIGQFAGIVLLGVALVALTSMMETLKPSVWGRVGMLGTAASVAVSAVLQAVDGVALKVMVDRWAQATGEVQAQAFESAFALRQIETGMASYLSILFGLTISTFGISLLLNRRFPRWLGWLGLVGGIGTIAAGIAQAYTGFSILAMRLSMPSSCALLLWAIAVGIFMWRLAPAHAGQNGAI
jgi:hypothetical protein